MKIRHFLNKNTTVLCAIFFIALILRCLFIDSRGIWYDDAFSIQLARQDLTRIVSGTAADTMPPLYYFLLHLWMEISSDIWWFRVLSILLSMGGLVFLFWVTKEIAGLKAAYWAILWGAFSPFQIYHAQELRMYALLQLTQAAYIYFFFKISGSTKPGWMNWAAFILCGALSMYTHNLAVFFLPIPDLILLIRKQWKLLFRVILAQFMILLLFLPWIFLVPGQIQKIQTAFWTLKPVLLDIVQSAVNFTGSLYPSGLMLMVVSSISMMVFLIVLFLFFRRKTIPVDQKLFFGLLIFLVPVELFVVSYLMRPIFVTRGFITSILFFCGMSGIVINDLQNKTARFILGITAVVVAILALPSQYLYEEFPRSQFDQAIQEISSQLTDDDIILHDNKLSFLPSYIYHPEIPQIFLADTPGSSNDTFAKETQKAMGLTPEESVDTALKDYDGVYFVVFSETLEDYQDLGVEIHPVLAWLDNHYQFVDKTNYQDLLIYQYSK